MFDTCTRSPYRLTFTREPLHSFVEFLLYKIFAQTVGDVDTTLPQVGVVNKELLCEK